MSGQCCTLARLLILVDGNWRNAVYIQSCSTQDCHLNTPCLGHLFTADRDGAPVVIPIELFQWLTGEQIDPSECRSHISRLDFENMYRRTLLWFCNCAKACGVRHLAAEQCSLPCSAHRGGEDWAP